MTTGEEAGGILGPDVGAGAFAGAGRATGGRARGLSTRFRALPRPAALWELARAEASDQLDRLFIWVPVAFGAGAAAYLGLKSEPALWPAAGLAAALGAAALTTRRLGLGRAVVALLTLLAVAAAGFSVAKLRSDHVAAPIARAALGVVEVRGFVVDIDTPSARGPRLVIAPVNISGTAAAQTPTRVRIVLPPGYAFTPGTAIAVKALLDPPPSPAAPGAYDFARDAWFQGEGGVGLARDAPQLAQLPPPPWRLKAVMALNALRWRVALRLASDMNLVMGGRAGDAAGLAIAVTTSHQDWLSAEARNDLRGSGLAHMLAIAGLHTAALSGFVFFGLRALIAAWPWLALRVDGKKLAAAGGLLAVILYLLLSGAHPPARRAAITASIAFAAILLDRRAISLRSLALAALVVLLFEPEVVIQPGFEMSFCATASLVALAEVWPRRSQPAGLPWPIAWLQRARDGLVALFMVSLVAGAATGPFAIQHFNRVANFGLLANLTADFIASAVMMPFLAVSLLLEACLPMLARPFLFVAGWAARAILWLGHVFATAPMASISPSAAPEIALALSYLGIIFLCLWKGRLRWAGLPLAFAVAFWPRPTPPVAWISNDGADAAIISHGDEVALRPGVRTYATDLWAQRRGLNVPADMQTARGARFDCDYWSCSPRAGVTPAISIWWTRRNPHPERLAELCARSDILVLRADMALPANCHDVWVLRRGDFARGGAAEIYGDRGGWKVLWSEPIRGRRPWTTSSVSEGTPISQ